MKKRKFKLSTTHMILISFLAAILLGSILLALPISTKSGESVSYIDALFTATTATCVTGLVTLPTVSTWSVFGQVVILLLIQIGGHAHFDHSLVGRFIVDLALFGDTAGEIALLLLTIG